eukprot:5482458-Karenia_brevis.AAC.1
MQCRSGTAKGGPNLSDLTARQGGSLDGASSLNVHLAEQYSRKDCTRVWEEDYHLPCHSA